MCACNLLLQLREAEAELQYTKSANISMKMAQERIEVTLQEQTAMVSSSYDTGKMPPFQFGVGAIGFIVVSNGWK